MHHKGECVLDKIDCTNDSFIKPCFKGYKTDTGEEKAVFILFFLRERQLQGTQLRILRLFNAFLWGFAFPLLRDYPNRLIKSEVRGTVLSLSLI